MAYRDPTAGELRLLAALLRKAQLNNVDSKWLKLAVVESLEDAGMGSFRIEPANGSVETRRTGRCAAELQFDDSDGVPVLVSLYLDAGGEPYEVDVWRSDFQPLMHVPIEL